MLGALLVLALVVADLATLVLLGRAVGAAWAVLAFVLGLVAAAFTLRAAAPYTAFRVAMRLRGGEMPAAELADGLLLLVAAALFAFPGLGSDAIALVFALPGLRRLPRAAVLRWARARFVVVGGPPAPPPSTEAPSGAVDVEFRREP